MAVNLTKGGNVSLTKEDPALVNVLAGLGWKNRVTDGAPFDLDVSAFLVTETGKVANDKDFVFYNNNTSSDGSVITSKDNLDGTGESDDETVTIALDKVPAAVSKIVISVSIHEAEARKQNFGQVTDAYVRILNNDTKTEITKFDLDEDASMDTSVTFGELYRHDGGWKFKAIGSGSKATLVEVAASYGVTV